MFKKMRNVARTKLGGVIIYRLLRLYYCALIRMKIENENEWSQYLEKGGRVLICLWHQQLLMSIIFFLNVKNISPVS